MTNHYLKFTGSGVAALGEIYNVSITDNDNVIDLTLDAENKVEIDEYLPMSDVTELYFDISNAQYDDYKKVTVKSGEEILAEDVIDNDNYSFNMNIDHANITGDIEVNVESVGARVSLAAEGEVSLNMDDITFQLLDSNHEVIASVTGENTIYLNANQDFSNVAYIGIVNAGEPTYIYATIQASNYDSDPYVYFTESFENASIEWDTGLSDLEGFTLCKYVDVTLSD